MARAGKQVSEWGQSIEFGAIVVGNDIKGEPVYYLWGEYTTPKGGRLMKPASKVAATESAALSAATAIMGGAPAKPAPKKAKAKRRPKSQFRSKGARDTSDKAY